MEEWKEYRYTDIATLIGGGTPKTSNPSYWGGNIPWLSVKDFGNDAKYVYQTEKTITEEGLNNSSTKLLQKDDIIISARGTIGEMAMIPFPMSFNQSCFGIRGKENVDKDFLYYLTKTKINNLKSSSHGSVFDTITRATFDNIIVSLPSLPTQQKIANILSSLDDKIEVNRRINEQLEELAQALFKSWFVDFEPFKDGEFVESELGMIPKGWKVCELSDILYISKDSINPSKTPDNQFHHYSIPAYDNSKREEVQEGKAIMSNKFKVTNKTTLFSKLNPRIKRVWFIDNVKENAICSTEFVPYKAKNNELTYYVNGLINSDLFYNQALSIVNGATGSHQRFHPQDTLKFNIAFNESVAKEYSTIVEPVVSKILVNQQEILYLTTLRDTLLPKLMSGEMDVNERGLERTYEDLRGGLERT